MGNFARLSQIFCAVLFKHSLYNLFPEDDVVERQRFIVFRIYTFTATLISLGVFTKMYFTLHHVGFFSYLIPVLSAVILINFLCVVRIEQLKRAYAIMLVSSCLLLHAVAYSCGGIQTAGSFYFPAIILYSYMLLGRKGGMAITALILTHIIYLFLVSKFTDWTSFAMFSNSRQLIEEDFLTNILLTFLLIAVLSNYLQSNKNVIIEKITKDKKRLEVMNTELLVTNRYLEKKNAELDKFASVAAHDLRSPLRAIGSLCDMVLEDSESLKEESKNHLTIIKGRIERTDKLLTALRNYSHADQGMERKEIVDTEQLIRQILKTSIIPENNRVIINGEFPIINTSRLPLERVFRELTTNAFLFNNSDSPETVISSSSNEDSWRFSVKDNGPGIDSRFHEKIFVIFQTLNSRDMVESSGAGLAICRKIVEENGGTIGVESSAGSNGSEFWFTWPAISANGHQVTQISQKDVSGRMIKMLKKAG